MLSPLLTACLALSAIVASIIAWMNLRRTATEVKAVRLGHALTALCAGGSLLLWLAAWWQQAWGDPFGGHDMGMLFASGLFAGMLFYLQTRPRMYGTAIAGAPLLALMLTWAFCASSFTLRPFHDSDWPLVKILHLASVYAGTISAGLAAAMGGYYLIADRRLKKHIDLKKSLETASLVSIEHNLIRMARLGFGLISFGLITGAMLMVRMHQHGDIILPDYYPVIIVSGIAWLLYLALLHPPLLALQSRTAAWIAIACFFLILTTFGVVMWRISSQMTTDTPANAVLHALLPGASA